MRASGLLVLALISLLPGLPVAQAQPTIPGFWDTRERLAKPDLSQLERLRFLTTTDFRPFNFLDSGGRLSGFHIDLARAICAELAIEDRCQIQALPWEELEGVLARGEGDAIIAGMAVNEETRGRLAFSRPYMQFPARFLARKASELDEPLHTALEGKRVGVLAGSAHEQMLRDYFPQAQPVTYSRMDWLLGGLEEGRIDAAFSDGLRLSSWLTEPEGADCCRFVGGPYVAPEYLGPGLAIAVSPENAALARALDYALSSINAKGIFAELYLRYFPVSFF